MATLKFPGIVTAGKFHLLPGEKELFLKHCQYLKNGEYYLTIKREKEMLSPEQRNYIFGTCYPMIAEHTGYSVEQTHELMKEKFFFEHVEMIGRDGSKETVRVTKSLSQAAEEDMRSVWIYTEEMRRWALEFLGVNIPPPKRMEN